MGFKKGNQINKGRIPWNKGKPWSQEMKDKLSEIQSKLKVGRKNKGNKWSEEARKRFSELKQGANNNFWKGGKIKDGKGYILIYYPEHPFVKKNRHIFEHRLVMEKHLGRYLRPKEVVHHINGIVDDNRIENLMLFSNESSHKKFHHKYTSSYKKEA